jgi:hypothetical protein
MQATLLIEAQALRSFRLIVLAKSSWHLLRTLALARRASQVDIPHRICLDIYTEAINFHLSTNVDDKRVKQTSE